MNGVRVLQIEDIGPLVRDLRTSKQWTQAKLAKKVECSPTLISQIESADRIPHTPMLMRILDALGYSLVVTR